MSDAFDDFVNELQSQILEETQESYGKAAYDLWRELKHFGPLETANGVGAVTGTCGDTIRIFLRIEDDNVREAGFTTDGCGSSQVCGSMAADLALGRSCDTLAEISGELILEKLGGLPEEDQHCARLAANALHEALGAYYQNLPKMPPNCHR